ncbi:IS3 family transposase [Paenibacillus shunpengii]|uniref:IS3 family transposase n=1 Tax=Paenibacillus shunpengii TaxID=2054424 RepID=A0ABW5SMA4_9BACL|nr:hypothetical protein BK126_18555 [Paenibacillus sp. FSL H7-0326]
MYSRDVSCIPRHAATGWRPNQHVTIEEAQRRIEEFIRFYNEERAQSKLNKLTPVEYRNQLVRRGLDQTPSRGVFCLLLFQVF